MAIQSVQLDRSEIPMGSRVGLYPESSWSQNYAARMVTFGGIDKADVLLFRDETCPKPIHLVIGWESESTGVTWQVNRPVFKEMRRWLRFHQVVMQQDHWSCNVAEGEVAALPCHGSFPIAGRSSRPISASSDRLR